MEDILFFVWMLVLPVIGLLSIIFVPIFWFFIVPKIARTLTWKRFSKCSFHFIGDDTGFAYLVPTTEELPEGVVKTKYGYRFLPRPISHNPGNPDGKIVEQLMLRRFVWRDIGKPIWFGYAGKVTAINPATLALVEAEKKKKKTRNPVNKVLRDIEVYVKGLPKTLTIPDKNSVRTINLQKELKEKLELLKTTLNYKPLTILDPTKVKEIAPKMWTPSQIDALATNREWRGIKRAGKQYTPLILGAGTILAILIFGIIALKMFGGF